MDCEIGSVFIGEMKDLFSVGIGALIGFLALDQFRFRKRIESIASKELEEMDIGYLAKLASMDQVSILYYFAGSKTPKVIYELLSRHCTNTKCHDYIHDGYKRFVASKLGEYLATGFLAVSLLGVAWGTIAYAHPQIGCPKWYFFDFLVVAEIFVVFFAGYWILKGRKYENWAIPTVKHNAEQVKAFILTLEAQGQKKRPTRSPSSRRSNNPKQTDEKPTKPGSPKKSPLKNPPENNQ